MVFLDFLGTAGLVYQRQDAAFTRRVEDFAP